MRVLLASTFVPFIRGGGVQIVTDLERELRERGHETDTVLLPFSDAEALSTQMLALRLLDLTEAGERMVAIRTPSYLLEHPNKVVWFIHHHRGAYDLWGTRYQDLPTTREGVETRSILVEADNVHLRTARRVFSNSRRVSDRLRKFNRIESEVLYPPLGATNGYRVESFGDFVFCPGRLSGLKRQALLIEAMTHVRSDVRLVIAGSPDHESDLVRLRDLIDARGIGSRVRLMGSWISEEEKQRLFAYALACAYVPYDEDSYGYVTLESYHSRKPVITCSDSGGTLELVEDDVTGVVTEPHPQALAEEMDRLYADTSRARRLGEAGYARMQSLNISWDHVIERLLA